MNTQKVVGIRENSHRNLKSQVKFTYFTLALGYVFYICIKKYIYIFIHTHIHIYLMFWKFPLFQVKIIKCLYGKINEVDMGNGVTSGVSLSV